MNQITHNRKQESGFTILEVIVSIAIFSVIVLGITGLVSSILVNSTRQGSLLANNDSARRVSFTLMQELRNSSTSATGGYAMSTASDQQIIFYSKTSTTIDRIRYYVQNGALYKGVTKPSGNPLIYNLGSETVNLVQKDLANGANPIFYYYSGTYNGVTDTPLVQPVNVVAVKFVKINLSIFKKSGPGSNATYTVTAGGALRNLKTNLGT